MHGSMRTRVCGIACALLLLFLPPLRAAAVIIDSGDGSGNTSAPPDDPGWDHVGVISGLTGVYLRNGWVLTAAHVGAGDILLDGGLYYAVPGTEIQLDDGAGTLADLVLFSITPIPALADLPVRSNPSLPTGEVVMVGKGLDRGAATDSDDPAVWSPQPGPLPAIEGWYWTGSGTVRWGTNTVEGAWTLSPVDTESFYTDFDEPSALDHTSHECQAANGDSGGALFAKNGSTWELAGIIWGIAGYSSQVPNTSSLRGDLTLAADLSFYAADIDAITATVPEPDSVLQMLVGAAAIAVLERRRGAAPSISASSDPQQRMGRA